MNPLIIAFIAVYLITLICYFFSETSGNHKRRVINKTLLASMFLVFGVVAYILNYVFFSYHLIMLLGIFFAFLGDIILLFSFTKGGITFIISNVLLFTYEWFFIANNQVPFSKIFYFIFIFLAFFGTFFTLTQKKVLDFKTKKWPILGYVCSVSLHGSLGLVLAFYFMTIKMFLFGIGLFLFMISDYFLMTHKFKVKKNWVLRCNSASYFIGLLLVVLSLIY